jgi:hypothetical protein
MIRDHSDDQVHRMIRRQPLPHIRRKQERLIPQHRPVTLRHAPIIPKHQVTTAKARRDPATPFSNSPHMPSDVHIHRPEGTGLRGTGLAGTGLAGTGLAGDRAGGGPGWRGTGLSGTGLAGDRAERDRPERGRAWAANSAFVLRTALQRDYAVRATRTKATAARWAGFSTL